VQTSCPTARSTVTRCPRLTPPIGPQAELSPAGARVRLGSNFAKPADAVNRTGAAAWSRQVTHRATNGARPSFRDAANKLSSSGVRRPGFLD